MTGTEFTCRVEHCFSQRRATAGTDQEAPKIGSHRLSTMDHRTDTPPTTRKHRHCDVTFWDGGNSQRQRHSGLIGNLLSLAHGTTRIEQYMNRGFRPLVFVSLNEHSSVARSQTA